MNEDPHSTTPGDPPAAIIKALRRLLRPLVKMLISFQITFPALSEILKSIYVEVAESDFPIEGKKQTDTRISLLTGVHRKDTKRLRHATESVNEAPPAVSVGAQMVGLWVSNVDYLNENGEPKPLPLKAEGESVSFETLVQTVCKQDMRARVVLDEWLRLGVAKLNTQNEVELNVSAFVPQQGIDEKAFYLGMNIADHIAAIDNNLQQTAPPVLERCVYYNGLSAASVEKLKTLAEKKSMEALTAVNAQARKFREQDLKAPQAADQRINFGLYFFHEATTNPSKDKHNED